VTVKLIKKDKAKEIRVSALIKDMRPVGSRVIVKVEAVNTMTTGGIILPDAVTESQRPARGRVLSCGRDCEELEVGDYVVFMMYAGSVLEDADDEANQQARLDKVIYRIVREKEVFGVWKKGTWRYLDPEPDDGEANGD